MTVLILWMSLLSRTMIISRPAHLNLTVNLEQSLAEHSMIVLSPKPSSSFCKSLAPWFKGVWLLKSYRKECHPWSACSTKKWTKSKSSMTSKWREFLPKESLWWTGICHPWVVSWNGQLDWSIKWPIASNSSRNWTIPFASKRNLKGFSSSSRTWCNFWTRTKRMSSWNGTKQLPRRSNWHWANPCWREIQTETYCGSILAKTLEQC